MCVNFLLIFIMNTLTIATMNCHGQTKFDTAKQLYIQNFLSSHKIDVLLCQETKIEENTFNQCHFINCNYSIIKNNSSNPFGTSVLIHNNLQIEKNKYDTEGRLIIFNIENFSIVNAYPRAGTDAYS